VLVTDLITPETPAAAAGWYPDPHGEPAHRWWDGQAWTDTTQPVSDQWPDKTPVHKRRWFVPAMFVLVVAVLLFVRFGLGVHQVDCVTNSFGEVCEGQPGYEQARYWADQEEEWENAGDGFALIAVLFIAAPIVIAGGVVALVAVVSGKTVFDITRSKKEAA
jgi:hypothetical protein